MATPLRTFIYCYCHWWWLLLLPLLLNEYDDLTSAVGIAVSASTHMSNYSHAQTTATTTGRRQLGSSVRQQHDEDFRTNGDADATTIIYHSSTIMSGSSWRRRLNAAEVAPTIPSESGGRSTSTASTKATAVTTTTTTEVTSRSRHDSKSLYRRQTEVSSTLASNVTTTTTITSNGTWIITNSNATSIIPRHEACFIMVARKAYLLGGRYRQNNAIDIYDPMTRVWSKGKAPPIELHHMQCVTLDNKIYIVSSWTGDYPRERNVRDIYIYDTVTDTWSTKAGLPRRRRRGAAASVVVGRRIYVSHGNRGGHETLFHARTLGWLDYYDVDTDTWTTHLPDAPNPRDHTGGSLLINSTNGDRMICIAGGRDGGKRQFFNRVILPTDCYNVETNTWSVHANIPQGRAGSAYGTSCDGKTMIIAGGEGFGQAYRNVDVFDGSNWTTLSSSSFLQIPRHGTGLAIDCTCQQIYVASGASTQRGDNETASVETYFPNGIDVPCTA